MTALSAMTAIDWASLALPVLIFLLWALERVYRGASGSDAAPPAEAPLLALRADRSYAATSLSDRAVHQRSNQAVATLLHDQSQFIGPDAVALGMQLLDPTAPYDAIQGDLPSDILALADLGYETPALASIDPAAQPLLHVLQPQAPLLDDALLPISPRVQQFMRLFVALLALAPLLYRLFFP